MDDEARELEALEQIMSDTNAEPIKLSYGLLRSITDNFSKEIGRGGFGAVYQGVLQNGDVAVKKLLNLHALTEKQFLDEITCLKIAKHKNIVRILGYCSETQGELLEYNGKNVFGEAQQKFLCFEYVPNGNIKHYLQQDKPEGDNWPLRFQMIRGICEGLQFLHGENINHLDLKPENVLLDAHMEPKIADFGLSRCLDEGQSKVITQKVVGTLRYIAPETIDHGEISFKSDVYALGIIIIELLTGVDNIDLDNWDKSLDDVDCPRMRLCAEIARNCTDRDRHNRPTVLEVIRELNDLETSMIPAVSSINQVTPTAFPGTELVDLWPLELSFPFVPNKEMRCDISLTNNTNTPIYCIIDQKRHKLPPMLTRAITVRRKPEEKLPSGTDNYEIEVLIVGCSDLEDIVDQMYGFKKASVKFVNGMELPFPRNVSFKDGLKVNDVSELHTALLTARFHVLNPALLTQVYWTEKRFPTIPGTVDDHLIDAMEAHPTEPWVLIIELSDRRVYIWNWQTGEIMQDYKPKTTYPKGKTAAKFIARKHWAVVGRTDGSIQVFTCPNMKRIMEFDAHGQVITSLVVHPTRSFLLASSLFAVSLWDWNRGWSCIGRFKTNPKALQLMFHPKHATSFYSFHEYGKCKLWRVGQPNPINEVHLRCYEIKMQRREFFYVKLIPFTYTDDGPFVAAIDMNEAIISDLLNEKDGHILDTTEFISVAVCHPSRPIFVTVTSFGFIRVWDAITYRLVKACDSVIFRPKYIGFASSGRLVIGAETGILVLDIDLE